jgi:hypothetical protein
MPFHAILGDRSPAVEDIRSCLGPKLLISDGFLAKGAREKATSLPGSDLGAAGMTRVCASVLGWFGRVLPVAG